MTALIVWSVIGAFLLFFSEVLVYRAKIIYATQDRSNLYRRIAALKGWKAVFWINSAVVIYLLIFDVVSFGIVTKDSVFGIAFYNIIFITALSLFDAFMLNSLFPDGWKPAFLKIPSEVSAVTVITDIKKLLCSDWILKIAISLLSAIVYKNLS